MGESNETPFDSPVRIALAGDPDFSDPPFKLDGLGEEAILKRLLLQIEFYFSNGNLWNDEVMRNVHNLYPDRWVPIEFLASLKRIQELTNDFSLIVQALKQSTELELDHSFTTVRRRVSLPPFNPKRDAKRCVYADTLPVGSTTRSLKKLFSRFGKVVRITPCLSLACNQDGPSTGPSPLLPGTQAKPDEVLDAILVEFADKYAAKQATVSIASHNCTYRDWKHRGLSSNANTPSTCRRQVTRTPQSTRFAPSHVEASPLSLAPSSLPLNALNGSRFSLTDFRLTAAEGLAPSSSDEAPKAVRSRLSAASPEFLPKTEPDANRAKPLSEIVKSFAPFTPSPKEPDLGNEQVEKLDDAFTGIFVLSKYAYLSRLERLGEFILPETPVPSSFMATPASGPIMSELTALGLARERSQSEVQAERPPPARSFTGKSPHIKSISSPHVKSISSPHIKSISSPFLKAVSPLPPGHTPATITSVAAAVNHATAASSATPTAATSTAATPTAAAPTTAAPTTATPTAATPTVATPTAATPTVATPTAVNAPHVSSGSMPSPIVVPVRASLAVSPMSPSISNEESDVYSPSKQDSPTKQGDSPTKHNDSPVKPSGLVEKKTPKITAGLPPRSSSTNWRSPNLVAAASGSLGPQGSPSPSIRALANPKPSPTGPRGINPSPTLKAAESPRLDADNSKKEPRSSAKPPKAGRRPRENSFEFSLIGSSQATSLADSTNVTVHLPASPSLSAMALMKSITPATPPSNAEAPKQKTPVLRPRKASQVEIPPAETGERRPGESPMEPGGLRRLSLQKRATAGVVGTPVSRYAFGPLEESAGFAGRGRGKPIQ